MNFIEERKCDIMIDTCKIIIYNEGGREWRGKKSILIINKKKERMKILFQALLFPLTALEKFGILNM